MRNLTRKKYSIPIWNGTIACNRMSKSTWEEPHGIFLFSPPKILLYYQMLDGDLLVLNKPIATT